MFISLAENHKRLVISILVPRVVIIVLVIPVLVILVLVILYGGSCSRNQISHNSFNISYVIFVCH